MVIFNFLSLLLFACAIADSMQDENDKWQMRTNVCKCLRSGIKGCYKCSYNYCNEQLIHLVCCGPDALSETQVNASLGHYCPWCGPSIQNAVACERTTLSIQCIPGQEIRVRAANYGRVSPTICKGDEATPDLNCITENSYDIVGAQCNGKESCSVDANNDVFGEPCRVTTKYLTVDYECTPK